MKNISTSLFEKSSMGYSGALAIVLLSFFSIVTFTSCTDINGKEKKAEELLSVPVMELNTMRIEVPKTYVCDIQAVQFVEVRSRVEGFLESIYVDEGQTVKKGQDLFRLTSLEFNESLNSANAKLMQAKAEAQAAKLEVERLKTLVNKNIISSSELELAKSRLSVAESQILEAESMVKNAQTMLSYTVIKSPFDGIVDRIPYKKGSLVPAGSLLTSVTDISEIFAYYKVTENEYLAFMREQIEGEKDGLDNELTLILADGQPYPLKGNLETMEADFERGTGSIAFRVRFTNPDRLIKHGATGKIQMDTELENIFLIPQKATFEIQDYTYVYVVNKEGKVQVRSFKPLQRFGLYYVTDSFESGDRIIYEGIQQVKDGMTIQPIMLDSANVYEDLAGN